MGIIMFGEKAQKTEIARLKEQVRGLEKENVRLEDKDANTETRIAKMRTDFRISQDQAVRDRQLELQGMKTAQSLEIENVNSAHTIAINELEADVNELEESFNARVEKEVSGIKKDLRSKDKELDKKEDGREKAHAERMKRLEAEYAAKMAKADRDLEADKISYRKYIRQEFNTRIENVEKENKSLVVENSKLRGANEVLENSRQFFTGKTEAMGNVAEKLIGALPVVSAEITTPEVVVQMPKSEVPAKQNQGGGEKKA